MVSPETAVELQESLRSFKAADDHLDAVAGSDEQQVQAAAEYLEARKRHQAVIEKAEGELDA